MGMNKVRTIFWKTNYVTQNILVFNIDINHCGNYLYMFITKKTELQRNV